MEKNMNGVIKSKMQHQIEFDRAIRDLLVADSTDGSLHGKVCVVCDRLLGHKDVRLIAMKVFLKYVPYLRGDESVPQAVRNTYKFTVNNDTDDAVLSTALLSPRSRVTYKQTKKRAQTSTRETNQKSRKVKKGKPHVICCKDCRNGLNTKQLSNGEVPRFSIANGWAIGEAPECLTRLNEIELALLSQARFRGHLFTYWGGCHRSIKGWHTFYDVDIGYTQGVLQHIHQFTDSDNIAVVLSGPFTSLQKEKIRKKVQINVPWMREAFDWLRLNNVQFADIEMPELRQPIVIDQSRIVESENSDIECREQITVVFPDGTTHTGGLNNGVEFEKAIAEMRSKSPGVQPYLTSRPSSRALRDYQDDNLIKAFPLQFPYGIGLPQEFLGSRVPIWKSLEHLLYLSQPSFHESCFVLVIHNMFERNRALTGAIWRVMGRQETCEVSEEEVNVAILRKKNGLPRQNGPGQRFLDSVHTVKKNLAHSNEAAMSARSQFMSLTHHFGCPKVLFTVSYDDSLDLRILT
jgi:hypothetical protein